MSDNPSTEQSVDPSRPSASRGGYRFLLVMLALFLFAFWYASRPGSPSGPVVDISSALTEATRQNKPVLLKFHADWCGPCRWMAKEVFAKDSVRQALADWVVVDVDCDTNKKLAEKYRVPSVPAFVILSPRGEEIGRWQNGAMSAEQLLDFLQAVRAKMKPAS